MINNVTCARSAGAALLAAAVSVAAGEGPALHWTFDAGDASGRFVDRAQGLAAVPNARVPQGVAGVAGAGLWIEQGAFLELHGPDGLIPATSDFSLFLWVGPRVYGRGQIHLVSNNDLQPGRSNLGLSQDRKSAGRLFWWTHGGASAVGKTRIDDGVWHHVGVTRAGKVFTLWVDGREDGRREADVAVSPSRWRVGAAVSAHKHAYRGFADDLRLYRRALSAREVAALHAGYGKAGKLPEPPPPPPPDFSRVTSELACTVVAYQSPATGWYIGSPALAILPDGAYVASHDLFGGVSPKRTTYIYRSEDRGATWRAASAVTNQTWSNLFVHRGSLYVMGPESERGRVCIRRSADGGRSWSEPEGPESGLLSAEGGFHTAPVPVVSHNGRLWRAFERRVRDESGAEPWASWFAVVVMSAPEDAELLKAESWRFSAPLESGSGWLQGGFSGWLEGNMVAAPGGRLVNLLRVHVQDGRPEVAAVVEVQPEPPAAAFSATNFVRFPGGAKKFTIRYDAPTGRYWTLSNPALPPHADANPSAVRQALALMSSADLRVWTMHRLLLRHPDRRDHGFQYVDFLVEGEDIVYVSRTAYEDGAFGANSYHDANFLTFHRIAGFRRAADERLKEEGP